MPFASYANRKLMLVNRVAVDRKLLMHPRLERWADCQKGERCSPFSCEGADWEHVGTGLGLSS